jgi:hypothetical protein
MWAPFRERLIRTHRFYVEQAGRRLLSQFEDISGEADKFADEWLEKQSEQFIPDWHDPAAFEEQAWDESVTFYGLLENMRNTTRLSIIAGMYHEWDKQLRDWLVAEFIKSFPNNAVRSAIWKANSNQLFDLLESAGWSVRTKKYYSRIDALRLVINVYKHGLGGSFDDLRKTYPEYLKDALQEVVSEEFRARYLDHTHLKVEQEHVEEFSLAIIEFWESVPESTTLSQFGDVPDWFFKALEKDKGKGVV